jgi:serine/threonine protein kinase
MSVIGRGAFSTIYEDTYNDIPCALKRADTKENSRRYIRHEVKILKALRGCKHIVQLLDYKISRKGYIKYERLDKNLYQVRDSLNHDDIKNITNQLLEALQEMHSRGVVHCDLKPENIMFDSSGVLKLIDFGNALFMDELLNRDQSIGTLNYRPPEYIIGAPLDHRVDYWALGCITIEILIGRELFSPRRDNKMYVHSCLLGEIIMIFGQFSPEFINSGSLSHRYFDTGNTFRFKYLLGKRVPIYKILRRFNLDKETAKQWDKFVGPFFLRK